MRSLRRDCLDESEPRILFPAINIGSLRGNETLSLDACHVESAVTNIYKYQDYVKV